MSEVDILEFYREAPQPCLFLFVVKDILFNVRLAR